MPRRLQRTVPAGMPIARLLSRSHLEIALGYLAGYVLLDWLSYVHPFAPFGITPWNPSTGLSFALILLFGLEFLPWLFVAPLLADALVRGAPLPIGTELIAASIIGAGYGTGAALLLSPRFASIRRSPPRPRCSGCWPLPSSARPSSRLATSG